jgi:hypothetical protein
MTIVSAPRIAILEADTPLPELEAIYGTYGEFFRRLLTTSAEVGSLASPECTSWNIKDFPEKYPDPREFDAILITGSRNSL